VPLVLAVVVALIAGYTDWRYRRIPNWLTVPACLVGIVVNTIIGGWGGLKASLLGAGLGLVVLLPFVMLRSLGAGDWKLAGALGAFVGWRILADLLIYSIFIAGIMALALIVYKGRLKRSLHNIASMLASMASFHMPGPEVSLDNPQALKVPYGVALAAAAIVFGVAKLWGVRG